MPIYDRQKLTNKSFVSLKEKVIELYLIYRFNLVDYKRAPPYSRPFCYGETRLCQGARRAPSHPPVLTYEGRSVKQLWSDA